MMHEKVAGYSSDSGEGRVDLAAIPGDGSLSAEGILLSEFAHASLMSYEIQEERSEILDHYLVFAGIVATASGIACTYAFDAHVIGPLLAVIVALVLTSVLSFSFFQRLLLLTRHHEEAKFTMNVIKEFYLRELRAQVPHLHKAIRWRVARRHGRHRARSTTFLTALLIALTSSFALAVASELVFYYSHDFGGRVSVPIYLGAIRISGFVIDGPVFVLGLVPYILYYRVAKNRMATDERIEADAYGLSPTNETLHVESGRVMHGKLG